MTKRKRYIKTGDYEGDDRRNGGDMNGLKISTQLAIRILYLAIIIGGIFFVYKFRVEATEIKVSLIEDELKLASKERAKNEKNISLLQNDVGYIKEQVDGMDRRQQDIQKDIKLLLQRDR